MSSGGEIIFSVQESPEGGYEAKALTAPIFTEADTLEELRSMVKDAVSCHFGEESRPKTPSFRQGRSHRGMRLPRDLSGEELVNKLRALGYASTRQTGSHIRLTSPHYAQVFVARRR